MSAIIDASDLEKVVTIPASKDPDVYIEMAHLVVQEDLVGVGYSEDRLTLIETYLAAHFMTADSEDGEIIKSKTGESEDTYASSKTTGSGYSSTRYGRQALTFDTKGILAQAASDGRKALFRVL